MTHRLSSTTVAPTHDVRTSAVRPERTGAASRASTEIAAETTLIRSYISDRFYTLVLQPTTLCNLNCSYCYLPGRKANKLMPIEVAKACARSIADQGASQPVDVVWHGGEPTATPLTHLRKLLTQFEELRRAGMARNGIQTNATIVDRHWCELFGEYDFEVGVSVDGPAETNQHRVDWRGSPTWERTVRGIKTLQEHGIEFTAICVVSPETIGHTDELVDFFTALGCSSVGFNLEEQEGTGRPPLEETAAYRFWRRLWQRRAAGNQLPIRDLDRMTAYVASTRSGDHRTRP